MSKNIAAQNIGWRMLERFGAQGITLIISITLARLLDPNVYGTVALVLIIISISNVFIDSGLCNSLIQKKDADDLDFSSVFYFNIFMCLLIYIFLYFFSPYIAEFYNINELTNIIRVLGINLLVSGFKNIQGAYVSRHLLFKKYFYSTLGGTIISAIVSIWMAFHGYGVWALVSQYLISNIVDTVILWFTVKWKPKLIFSFERLKKLFAYGSKILFSSLLDNIWSQLRPLIIGKRYTTEDLAYYNKGVRFPETIISSIIVAFDSVLLPVMADNQDNVENVKLLTKKSIKICSFIIWPMMIGLFVCADNIVVLLLTEKWLPVVPYLRIFCIINAFRPLHTSNLNSIKAIGRSDIILKLEIIKKIVGAIIIFITVRYGVFVIALGSILGDFIAQIINSWPNRKLINYRYIEQIKDITPTIILSLMMGVIVYCINLLGLNYILTLVIQIISGIIIYVGLSYLFKNDNLLYCIDIIKNLRKKA